MAKWGNADFEQLKQLQGRLLELQEKRIAFCEAAAKELTARLLSLVIKRTPVGHYDGKQYVCTGGTGRVHQSSKVSGKTGGTLRRGWTAGQSIGAVEYAQALPVEKSGSYFIIRVINPVKYASYVEFGHRTVGDGFVEGHYMLTLSEEDLERIAPQILEKKLNVWLKGAFGDGS